MYLIFLILFTVFHLVSSFINHTYLHGSNLLAVVLFDRNLIVCLFFFVIENTHFNEKFINNMNKSIFIIIVITLIVSLVQIVIPDFFVNPDQGGIDNRYISEGRIFSIYSWLDLNSLGISFPIMISILLGVHSMKNKVHPIVVISGIVVPFLTRARYVMLSAVVVFAQLFLSSKLHFKKKILFILVIITGIVLLVEIVQISGLNIEQIINERILEKETDMASARTRITSYYVFLQKFPENPWLGVGPATRDDVIWLLGGEAPLIHIGYLSYLYYYGIIGSLLFFISLFFILQYAWQVGKKHTFWGSFYGFLSFGLANTTLVYFNLSEMGIILAIIYLKYFKDISVTKPFESDKKNYSSAPRVFVNK